MTHASSFRIYPSDTEIPVIAFPHSIPTTGTMCHIYVHISAEKQVGSDHVIQGNRKGRVLLTILFWCKRDDIHGEMCS